MTLTKPVGHFKAMKQVLEINTSVEIWNTLVSFLAYCAAIDKPCVLDNGQLVIF